MTRPTIRHLAIFARDPAKLSKFYHDVLEMEVIHESPEENAYFVSDGYLTLALLPHRLQGSAAVGINHFGFVVEDNAAIAERFAAFGLEEPKRRGVERRFAEYRGADAEGNWFDLSERGYEESDRRESANSREVA